MALRADPSDSSEKTAAGGASALAGLPSYWNVAKCPPKTEMVGLIRNGGKRKVFNLHTRINKNSNRTTATTGRTYQ